MLSAVSQAPKRKFGATDASGNADRGDKFFDQSSQTAAFSRTIDQITEDRGHRQRPEMGATTVKVKPASTALVSIMPIL